MDDSQQFLDKPSEQDKLESAQDLALSAISQSAASQTDDDAELAASENLAETLQFLQNVIERNAVELEKLRHELKEKRQSLRNVFENDAQLTEATEQQQSASSQVKERKAKLNTDPQVTGLKTQIGEINEQVKEIEEALSNHLLNYYSMTNSKSFDTSDGDQWEFNIRAKVKSRKKS